jgi:hypothetical protein
MRSLFYILLFIFACNTAESPAENNNNNAYKIFVENNYTDEVSFFNRIIEKKANWSSPPNIIICDGIKISKSRIKKAISFWEYLGYSFGEVFEFSCPFDTQYHGAIYIMEPSGGFNFTLLANTHTAYAEFPDKRKEIIGSWIEIPNNNITKARILEHEIGHALGFQHTIERYHIMNKEFSKGGTRTAGLNSSLH